MLAASVQNNTQWRLRLTATKLEDFSKDVLRRDLGDINAGSQFDADISDEEMRCQDLERRLMQLSQSSAGSMLHFIVPNLV